MPFGSLAAFFDPFGTVPGSSLNWSQHSLLQKGARSRATTVVMSGPTIDTDRICRALESVGQNVSDVVDAVDSLVDVLDLRLDEQAKLLNHQVDLLTEIAQTLRSPARTRAAERIRDANELLRHHRNERALIIAEQAIDDDPNNDTAFVLAAWASLGLGNLERARGYFREAAQATTGERGAESRHMNAVYLAARLTFALDGPEAALRELDSADPFIDLGLRQGPPELSAEQICLSVLDPNKVGAFKFDRTVYYTANGQRDAALGVFREVADEHEIRFCLMTLTDPVLTTHEAVVDVATEALRIHDSVKDKIRDMLPSAEIRWQALCEDVQQHEIRNSVVASNARLDGLFTPNSDMRKALEQKWPPSKRWLEEFLAGLQSFHTFEAQLRPLIEHERMREAALDASIQDLLSQPKKRLLVDRARVVAVVGRHNLFRDKYSFERITVDHDGNVSVAEQEATMNLKVKYSEGGIKL